MSHLRPLPSPAWGGGRCALMLPPDAGTLYPEPRTQPWHTSHGVSMSCLETAPFSCSLPVSAWGVCQLQSYLSYLLPVGTLCACDIPTSSPRLGHCSPRLFQDWKGVLRQRSRTAFPLCHVPPPPPPALIRSPVPFCITTSLLLRKIFSQEGSDKLIHSQA